MGVVGHLYGGVMFMSCVVRSDLVIMSAVRLGKGIVLFWTDVWLGGVSLRVRFSRLYDLSVFKRESVFDMNQLGWG